MHLLCTVTEDSVFILLIASINWLIELQFITIEEFWLVDGDPKVRYAPCKQGDSFNWSTHSEVTFII